MIASLDLPVVVEEINGNKLEFHKKLKVEVVFYE